MQITSTRVMWPGLLDPEALTLHVLRNFSVYLGSWSQFRMTSTPWREGRARGLDWASSSRGKLRAPGILWSKGHLNVGLMSPTSSLMETLIKVEFTFLQPIVCSLAIGRVLGFFFTQGFSKSYLDASACKATNGKSLNSWHVGAIYDRAAKTGGLWE